MAWTNIPDDVLEPGKPIRSVDAIALRDNPIAIAQGLPGAPRVLPSTAIDWAASTNTAAERDWVLNRTAGAAVGAVGTYAWLGETSTTPTAPGGTRAGSALRYVGLVSSVGWVTNESVPINLARSIESYANTPAGTWRCMGHSLPSAPAVPATLWLRIS